MLQTGYWMDRQLIFWTSPQSSQILMLRGTIPAGLKNEGQIESSPGDPRRQTWENALERPSKA
jgi:hypothetical protein